MVTKLTVNLDCSVKLDQRHGGILALSDVMKVTPGIYDCIWILKRPHGRPSDGILVRLVDIKLGEGN